MFKTLAVPEIIRGLRLLTENTIISSSKDSKNWNDEWVKAKSPAEFIQTYLTDLGSRIQWQSCPQCQKEFNAMTLEGICVDCVDAREAGVKREQTNGELLLKSIGPYGVEKYSFQTFKKSPDNMMAFKIAEDFNPAKDNLYLWGPCGTGKTHLAGAVFKAAAGANCWIKWTNPIYLARGVRVRWANEEEMFVSDVAKVDVLVIDDLGVGRDVGAILQAVYEIVELRRNAKKNGLIITSNHSVQELSKKYGDDRFSSRISELCHVIELGGDDYRLRFER